MQVLSAYLLETPLLDAAPLAQRFLATTQALAGWLRQKGASDPAAAAGDFRSLTQDGSGCFTRTVHEVPQGRLESVRLEELTAAGQIFTTQVTATASQQRLRVHCTLSVAHAGPVVTPLPADARCPSILRTLLASANDWQLNHWPVAPGQPVARHGADGGAALAGDIRHARRSLPIVVVSEIEGAQLWPGMARELAFDLAGLASVVTIDEDAAWALSDALGKLHSCYRGAVRLYWPARPRPDGSLHFGSTVWTASDLLSNDRDGKGLQRLRAALRRLVMATAALSIPLPAAVREIEAAVAQARIAEIERRAGADSEALAIARLYQAENEQLTQRIEQLEAELAKAAARAEAAACTLAQLKAGDEPEADADAATSAPTDPTPGEVRYYKKIHSKGNHDVLVEVKGCRHTAWQNAAAADKARKGLERLTGRNDWKSLQHCGSCTGGGMWKVRW